MTFRLVPALTLALLVPALTGQAHADNRKIYGEIGGTSQTYMTWRPHIRVVTSGDDPVDSVRGELESDAGTEDLEFVETDSSLHGAASVAALPRTDADLTVTLYDTANRGLISFSGTLGADGSVTLTADNAKYDVELIAAELFPAAKGYDLAMDVVGADAYAVAYASVSVTEGSAVCLATDEKGNCLKWDTSKQVTTRAEVDWDGIGAVWEADTTLAHEGLLHLKAKTYDADGEKLATMKSKLGAPWLDIDGSVNSLATDEDPLTRVGLVGRWDFDDAAGQDSSLVVVSDGWSTEDELPEDAEVALTDGDTITVPVNSYQRAAAPVAAEADVRFDWDQVAKVSFGHDRDAYALGADDAGFFDLDTPVCGDSICLTVTETEEGYAVSATAFGADAGALPDEAEISLTVTDRAGATLTVAATSVSFDDEVTAVFANDVSFAADPVGLGLTGKVSLLGKPNRKGKQQTLAKGKFFAELARDADGDLQTAGGDKDEVVSSPDLVVAGAAVGLEAGDTGASTPPAIAYRNRLSAYVVAVARVSKGVKLQGNF